MQFRGYSLLVHDCSGTMGPSPCSISLALIRPRDLFRLLAIGMYHFLPVYHLGIAFLGRVEGQNITIFIIIGNGYKDPSSKQVHISCSANTLRKGMHSTILPPAMGKQ